MYNILIVDDEQSIRETFEIFLTKAGYNVYLAEDATTGLSIVENNEIDLIYTDIIMPKVTGLDMLNILKEKNADIPVIIMTGEPTFETAKSAVRDNAIEYLTKPINKETLLSSSKNALKKKQILEDKKKIDKEKELYRQNLENRVKERTNSLKEAIHGTISTMARVLELKDPYTAGHEKKVANLAYSIAKKMGLPEKQLASIYYAGFLHDIGKLLVPAEILAKPGKLTASEFALIKDHVVYGHELLKDVKLPWDISRIIYQHHERLDGSGYPCGISGNDMLIESRILSVADVVEAMASHRPYRPKLEISTALEEIVTKSHLYDKKVASSLVSLFNDDKYELSFEAKDIKVDILELDYI